MEPTTQQCMYMRDPDGHPTRVGYDSSTRRTSPWTVELRDGDVYTDDYGLVDLEEETTLTALKA
eukprot:6240474-Prorocentrum_lima.AAC.1